MAKRSSGTLVENIKTIVYAGLIAIGIRTVAFEPFNIPSGSMIPTLLIGDYLFVSKFSYGYSKYSLPFSPNLFSGRIFASLPQRGDVAVFKVPRDNSTDYIKRIVGLPGDRVQMKSGQLYINGNMVPRRLLGDYLAEESSVRVQVRRFAETLPSSTGTGGRVHDIVKMSDSGGLNDTPEFKIPPDHVFAMGDNRDNSSDSRDPSGGVGFIPLENLVGRAEFIFFSFDAQAPAWQFWLWPAQIRWSRLFSGIT
ncbi:MAG: signal peptidase I [Acetobacteraceae bacterium]|nr:signal peptidase I [Acetobacteraceae bacterium]